MAQRNRRRIAEPEAAPVSRPDWIVVALAGAGVLVAAYLTWLKWSGGGAALCTAGSGCDLVQSSRYATFLFVPTAMWGMLVYAAIGMLGYLGLRDRNWFIAFLLTAGAVGFSAYLTALSIFDIGATCVWCLLSATVSVALLASLLMPRAPETRKRGRLRPRQLTAYGLLAAAGAVVVGAFVFAAPFSAPPGYQQALARHLAATNAVMYGAYW